MVMRVPLNSAWRRECDRTHAAQMVVARPLIRE